MSQMGIESKRSNIIYIIIIIIIIPNIYIIAIIIIGQRYHTPMLCNCTTISKRFYNQHQMANAYRVEYGQ